MDYSLLVGIHDCTIPPAPDEDCGDSYGEEDGYVSGEDLIEPPVSPTTGSDTYFGSVNYLLFVH